jgi:hypothetical protein
MAQGRGIRGIVKAPQWLKPLFRNRERSLQIGRNVYNTLRQRGATSLRTSLTQKFIPRIE